MIHQCPCCLRAFEKMEDFPRVLVRKVERLALPEFMDQFSEEAALLPLQLSPGERQDINRIRSLGINRTPEIAAAYESEAVQEYFQVLESYQGKEVSPDEMAPPLDPHGRFKRAYPIPGTKLLLTFSEAEPEGEDRICQVMFLGDGPNLGSAGGPTLQEYGAIVTIHYEGRLIEATDRASIDKEL